MDHTVLPATHPFIHERKEPSCLYSVNIHRMALPERDSAYRTRLQLTTYLSTSKGRKAELA